MALTGLSWLLSGVGLPVEVRLVVEVEIQLVVSFLVGVMRVSCVGLQYPPLFLGGCISPWEGKAQSK